MSHSILTLIGITAVLILVLALFVISKRKTRESKITSSVLSSSSTSNARNRLSWMAENLLEERLEGFRDNTVSRSAVVNTLLASEVFVLTRSEGEFDPFDCETKHGAMGSRLIPIYSSLTRLKREIRGASKEYSHVHTMKVRDWVTNLPGGFGLILNPSIEYSIEILPDDVSLLKMELS